MEHKRLHWEDLCCTLSFGIFESDEASECHIILELTDSFLTAANQFDNLDKAVCRLFNEPAMLHFSLVWKRYFVSDVVNQAPFAAKTVNEAVSVIQQPPLNGTKVALWLYAVENASVYTLPDGATLMERPTYSHIFHTGLRDNGPDSYIQTQAIFFNYIDSLNSLGMNLEAHCLRTWLFVQDIDNRYKGMVEARNSVFEEQGLTPATHFIASTGIEGSSCNPQSFVSMDAYAIREIHKEQITFLKGISHLNPTHEYGVAFERGVAIQYGDRRHVIISGTASINNKGEIVYPSDILKQTERTLENVSVLLNEAGCSLVDAAHLIVYLRDAADYALINCYFKENYPGIPTVILLAPVCRPGWLVEIECMAVKECADDRFDCY